MSTSFPPAQRFQPPAQPGAFPAAPIPPQPSVLSSTPPVAATTPPLGMPSYPYPYQPSAGAVTMMPVLRPVPVSVPPAATASAANPPAIVQPAPPAQTTSSSAAAPEAASTPALQAGEQATATQPVTYAEEVGEKVTRLIENNPQLEAQLKNLDLDTMMTDPESSLNRLREALQRSRLVRFLLRFDKRIASAFPADTEPMARSVLKWLKTSPASGGESSLNGIGEPKEKSSAGSSEKSAASDEGDAASAKSSLGEDGPSVERSGKGREKSSEKDPLSQMLNEGSAEDEPTKSHGLRDRLRLPSLRREPDPALDSLGEELV